MCWGPSWRQRLLPGGAASEWGSGCGTLGSAGKPRCWGWSGNHVPTISCSRTTSPTLLMCMFSPIGRQWGAPGLRAEQALVSGRSHQLGHRLRPEKQTWRVHQSDRTPALDIQQDGGESLCGTLTEQMGNSEGGVPGRGPKLSLGFSAKVPSYSCVQRCSQSAKDWDRTGVEYQASSSLYLYPSSSFCRTELKGLKRGGPRLGAGPNITLLSQ